MQHVCSMDCLDKIRSLYVKMVPPPNANHTARWVVILHLHLCVVVSSLSGGMHMHTLTLMLHKHASAAITCRCVQLPCIDHDACTPWLVAFTVSYLCTTSQLLTAVSLLRFNFIALTCRGHAPPLHPCKNLFHQASLQLAVC